MVPPICHIFKTLLLKLLNLVAPSKEGRLIGILAGLIVIGGHSQNVLLGELAGVPTDLPKIFVRFFDHGNLQPFLLARHHSTQEIYLLGSYLPIASESFLNSSDPEACVYDILLNLLTHSKRFQHAVNHLLTCVVSQVNAATECHHTVFNLTSGALFGSGAVAADFRGHAYFYLQHSPEDRSQEVSFFLFLHHVSSDLGGSSVD